MGLIGFRNGFKLGFLHNMPGTKVGPLYLDSWRMTVIFSQCCSCFVIVCSFMLLFTWCGLVAFNGHRI